jgi:hypothetical protein
MRLLMFFIFLAGLQSTGALAWSVEGHHIVAAIASANLTPAARSQVRDLLGSDGAQAMVDVSTWADEIRSEAPYTFTWHFVNIPVGSAGYDPARDCRYGNCVIAQIERFAGIVADVRLERRLRAQALRFLIHFVADLHQPLHAADNSDAGGTRFFVVLRGRPTNMHAVWDDYMPNAVGHDAEEVARRIGASISPQQRQDWSRSSPVQWANESFRLASREIYGAPTPHRELPNDYPQQMRAIAAEQLSKAGIRLASVLNAALQ